ncbi:MAG: hypothetical protein KIT09_07960 [Bryobacteraceae bacterium]|nr:hypothetical protein [Bryobacteraceae bacterium]
MKVLANPAFRGSKRSHDLLQYVVENALTERFDSLKERIIGMEVFGRPAEYDTSVDSVVRVTANEVRKRLAQFSMEDSGGSPVRIELPVGSYIPEFHLTAERAGPEAAQIRVPEAEPPARAEAIETEQPKRETAPAKATATRWWAAALVLAILAILASNAWWWRRTETLVREGWVGGDRDLPKTLPWSALAEGTERPVFVVLADVAAGTSQELLGRPLSLTDYMRHSYLESPGPVGKESMELARRMASRPYTSATDAALAARFLQLHPQLNRRIAVRFGRNLRIEDLKESNAILLGGGYSNLWERLVAPQANFRIEFETSAGMHVCTNRSPKAGEARKYAPAGPTGTTGVAYALVSLLPGPRENGHVLLLAGTNTEGTQEAGDFVSSRERISDALRKIGVDPKGPARHFELLLKLDAVAGSSYHSEVIAHRVIVSGAAD